MTSMSAPRRIDTTRNIQWPSGDNSATDAGSKTSARGARGHHSCDEAVKGYSLVVVIAAVVTALAYLVRELILVWP